MKLSRLVQLVAGIAIAVGGLWVFFREVNVNELALQIRSFSFVTFAAICVIGILAIFFRALRWRLILPSSKEIRTRELFAITMVGFMINNILPARAGEAARCLLVWKRCNCRPFVSIGSLLVERCIDILFYILLFLIPVFSLAGLHGLVVPALLLGGVFLGAVVVLALHTVFPSATMSGAGLFLRLVPRFARARVSRIGEELASNLEWCRDPRRLAGFLLFSALILVCQISSIVLLVGDWTYFSFVHGMFATASAALGAAIPLSPGYVGTLHAVLLQGLVAAGVMEDRARAITLLYHASGYIPVTALGIYFYFKFNLRFKELSRAKEKLGEEPSTTAV